MASRLGSVIGRLQPAFRRADASSIASKARLQARSRWLSSAAQVASPLGLTKTEDNNSKTSMAMLINPSPNMINAVTPLLAANPLLLAHSSKSLKLNRSGYFAGQQRYLSSLPSGGPLKPETTEQLRKDTQKQIGKLRTLFQQYGAVAIGTYGGIYVGTLFLLYALIEQRVIGAGDAISLLESTGLNNFVDMSLVNSKAGNFALAWILTKFTEPLRLVLAVSVTPTIARALGRAPPLEPKE